MAPTLSTRHEVTVGVRRFARFDRTAPIRIPLASIRIPVGQFRYRNPMKTMNGRKTGTNGMTTNHSGFETNPNAAETPTVSDGVVIPQKTRGKRKAL